MKKKGKCSQVQGTHVSRRQFLKASAVGMAAVTSGNISAMDFANVKKEKRPNFLFILCDQLRLNAIAAHGCPYVKTPNIDRLVNSGISFMESHSTNPVCSPARSTLFTGRMPVETSVVINNRAICCDIPNMGQWLGSHGYNMTYCGKWHLAEYYTNNIPGFTVLTSGDGEGDVIDNAVSRSCAAYLKNYSSEKPFVLVASLLQPHDICYLTHLPDYLIPFEKPSEEVMKNLPELPPNFDSRPKAPDRLARRDKLVEAITDGSSIGPELRWKYYNYIYYRQVEMLDADVGRILDALEDSHLADDTIVIFTSDHGEGGGSHGHVQKWTPYEESIKVPLIFSCPKRFAGNLKNKQHLVSGLDVMPTICDYARVPAPPDSRGKSLRLILENKNTIWHDHVVAEALLDGRMVRTQQYKYFRLKGDSVEQLFDMKKDPLETTNLFYESKYASIVQDHRNLLDEWESRMKVAPLPHIEWRWG